MLEFVSRIPKEGEDPLLLKKNQITEQEEEELLNTKAKSVKVIFRPSNPTKELVNVNKGEYTIQSKFSSNLIPEHNTDLSENQDNLNQNEILFADDAFKPFINPKPWGVEGEDVVGK